MNRVNYGVKSGVIIDRCKNHGVWLDGGELRHLMEWMKMGGKLLDQDRKEQLKMEELKKLEEQRRNPQGYQVPTTAPVNNGGIISGLDPDIGSVIGLIASLLD